jgi:hypothetical protein
MAIHSVGNPNAALTDYWKQVSKLTETLARAPAPSASSPGAAQEPNPFQDLFKADGFEASGSGGTQDFTQQLSNLLDTVNQLKDLLGGVGDEQAVPELGNAGGGAPAVGDPQGPQASYDAAKTQELAPTSGPSNSPGNTYSSDAGPGFGPPSAGSTEQVNPSEPWLAKNNVGSPYNSNMQLIDPSQKSQYKYTNTFTNNTNQPQTITLWNKTGENGGPNDGQNFDKSTPKTFTLQPGQSQVVAFDSNSSVAWCASKDGTAKPGANSGQTWGEATFANAGTGWSGYDTSQIEPAGHNGNMSITNDATGKTVTEANAWQTPSDNPAGLDVGVPAGPLNLTTTFS